MLAKKEAAANISLPDNNGHHKQIEPNTNMNNNNNNNNNSVSIEAKELYELLSGRNVLLMDCRPTIEYNEYHIDYECCMNIPQEIIIKGLVIDCV